MTMRSTSTSMIFSPDDAVKKPALNDASDLGAAMKKAVDSGQKFAQVYVQKRVKIPLGRMAPLCR